MIHLLPLPPDQPTSYLVGSGLTRRPDGTVPHLSEVRLVGTGVAGWRAHAIAVAALAAANEEMVDRGGEPARVTDAWREQAGTQARLREGYEAWLAAGSPDPGGRAWRAGMKTAYAKKPGESNHGWGGAFDLGVAALKPSAKVARGSNAALAEFWEIGAKHGLTPIISDPNVNQSEAWHFDCYGPLRAVYDLYVKHGLRAEAASQTARVGCVLARTMPTDGRWIGDLNVAHLQARCAIAGAFPGRIDGSWGPKTRAALSVLGISSGERTKPETLLPAAEKLGADLLEKFAA